MTGAMNRAQFDTAHMLVNEHDPERIDLDIWPVVIDPVNVWWVYLDLYMADGSLIKAAINPAGEANVTPIPAEEDARAA